MFRKLRAACLVLLSFAAATSVAGSATRFPSAATVLGTAAHMSFGHQAGVPRGYYDLCRKGNSVCRITAGRLSRDRGGAVVLTDELAQDLDAVNSSVNRHIRPVADAPGHDRWSVEPAGGDCEDYAITKKYALMRKGWPSTALVVALVRASGQQHAVLVVRTTAGDFALDNLRTRIVAWNKTGYRFEKVQSPSNTWLWHTL